MCYFKSGMKLLYTLLILFFAFSFTVFAQTKTPVLVELFTSEGCPTCPPADANLLLLELRQPVADVEIIPLALHVDYWNSATWQDKYSSPLFSRRQEIYSRIFKLGGTFTPQMVIDGAAQLIGGKLDEARQKIAEAAKLNKAKIELSLADDKLKITLENLPPHQNSTVYLAVAESELPNNLIAASGNSAKHPPTVRALLSVGSIAANAAGFQIETFLQLQPEWKKENLNFVVFVQDNVSRRVIALGQVK